MSVRTMSIACLLGPLTAVTIPAAPSQGGTIVRPNASEVQYASRDATIAATLLVPSGDGPFPGVVIVHGSGNSDRSNPWTAAYAEGLVTRGIAVLHPDKRGSGESGGKWQTADFLTLADDAIAGVAFLRSRPRIEPEHVGVIGFSQGGHIVPAAAARSDHIAFAVSVSGSTVPIFDQIFDEIALLAEREGLKPDDIATLAAIHKLGIRYALTGEGWDEYAAALTEAKVGRLNGKQAVDVFPTEPAAPPWAFLRAIGNFDPMDYWKRVTVPVVFVYGGHDTQIRVTKSVDRILDVLDPLDPNYTLIVFHKNGHALYRDDQLDFLARWIHERGGI